MPRGMSAVAATINTTESAVFQSSRSYIKAAAATGGLGGITVLASPGDGDPCAEVEFAVAAASAATLRVRIPGVHNAGEYAFLLAGETKRFIGAHGATRSPEIDVVYVSTAAGTATFNFTVTA